MQPHVSIFEALVLGVVQGITEFLPISSDGHLAITAMLFGTHDMPLAFVVMLHAGTLLATLIMFRKDVAELLTAVFHALRAPKQALGTDDGRMVLSIIAGTIPTGIVGLLLEEPVEAWSSIKWIVGLCLFASGLALVVTLYARSTDVKVFGFRHSVLVGIAQGMAVLPGLSRSGSTIALAMVFGMAGPQAFRYSFLLSLPAVGGAVLLKALRHGALSGLGVQAAIGAVVSFFVGMGALYALRAAVSRGKLWVFAAYLIPLGVGVMIWGAMSP
jgi:undecaprenyl-diphosphatase